MQKLVTITFLGMCFLATACADEKVVPQKSPCAALDNGPCGPKRPVNGKSYNTVQVKQLGAVAS